MGSVKDLDMVDDLTDDQDDYEELKEEGLVSDPASFLLGLQAP